jgi:hypothetical protein
MANGTRMVRGVAVIRRYWTPRDVTSAAWKRAARWTYRYRLVPRKVMVPGFESRGAYIL